jgi:hypothetical protein
MMGRRRSIEELFAGQHFDREVIILCVRWYLRYKLSFRDRADLTSQIQATGVDAGAYAAKLPDGAIWVVVLNKEPERDMEL